MLRLVRPFLAAVFLSIPALSNAADVTWTGASDDLWDTAANWSPTGAPTSGDTAVFGAVPTSNQTIVLTQPSYTLTGLVFQDSGFFLQETGTTATTLTITGGAISSDNGQSISNLIVPTLTVMTAVDNTITVTGDSTSELELGDLSVTGTGTFTANVVSSLCLGGATSITGAFVKTGVGEVCTEQGLTAQSTTVQNGLFMVEGNSSLGHVVVSSAGTVSIMASATTSAHSVTIAGVVEVGLFADNGEVLVADQSVTVQNGGSLTGFGTVQSNVTVEAGGRLAPADPADHNNQGALTIEGDVDFQINSIALFTIVAPNVLQGGLSITGNLTLAGLLSMNDTAEVGLYTLIDFTGDLTGSFAGLVDTVDGYNYNIIYNANSVQVSVTAVPEPGTIGLVVIGGCAVLFRLRRRC